ncbi:MAG: sodium:proton antiporter [Agarilytica sp.]
MIYNDNDLASAVFIFSKDRELSRELNYCEYEAMLDAYVPAPDMANRELPATYVEMNSRYQIVNAVFFMVKFDSRGFIDQSTSVPLFQLALHARKGLDLGNGPIGFVCASQCPIKHMSQFLWNPDLKTKRELKSLVEAVKRNRISIQFHEADPEVVRQQEEEAKSRKLLEQTLSNKLRKDFDKELRDHMAQTIREQRLKTQTLLQQQQQSILELKQQYNARIDEYRLMMDQQKSLLDEARDRNEALKETIDGQAQKIQGLREYFEVKLEQAETVDHDQLDELKHSHEIELHATLESETKELNELLQMREVEILYRNEQEAKLLEETERLRKENEMLIQNSGDHLLAQLIEKGISFVSYQPGAGHITVPMSDIASFIDSPTRYVAGKCGVSEQHYNEWLEHYHVPICQSVDGSGNICGENIGRIESPADFIVGESDCCHQHRSNGAPRLKIAGSQ